MHGNGLIINVGGSILPSEDDLNDTNPANENFPNTIMNIPSESPRSSLTKALILSGTELGCPQTPESRPKAAQKIKDDGIIRNLGGKDYLKDKDPVNEIVPNTISDIPLESPRSSLNASTRLSDAELGYPPTSDSRPLIFMNVDHNDAGYYSDGNIGPLFDAVRDKPPLCGPDEEETGVGVTSKVPDIPDPVTLKIRDIEKLKFVELKDALKKRGCSAKGNKPELTARLKDAIEKNLEVVCDIGEGEVEKFSGEGFSIGAKWELEAVNEDDVCIEEDIREIGGKVFRE